MCDEFADQRAENRRSPNVPVSYEELAQLGIFVRKLNPETMLESIDGKPSEVDRIMASMGYKNRDEVCCAPDKLPNYETKLKMFFEEHIHEDEEIRLIKEGSGYFDFRNRSDEWIRVLVKAGDFIIVPAGMYHRFTMDETNFTHAIRLFSDAPKWIAINRPCEDNPFRQQFLEEYVQHPKRKTVLGDADDTTNILIDLPTTFDAVIKPIIHGGLSAGDKDLLVLYFTGTPNPKTGDSWCPDCVTADPLVAGSVKEAESKGRRVVFVECTVDRSSYLKNPSYPYRVHPFIELPSIPTLMVFEATDSEDEGPGVQRLVKQESGDAAWLQKL